jgi:LemA protein
VAFSRQAFNDAVMRYNPAREQFPSVIIANAFSFDAARLFEVNDEKAKQAVKVSFSHQSAA